MCMNFRVFIKYWLPVILFADLIFYGSSIPEQEIPVTGLDLSPLHIPEFFILSYLLFRAFSREKISYLQILVLSLAISTLYGVTDEIHQLFVPGRNFSFFDMAFNFIGSSLILFKFRKK